MSARKRTQATTRSTGLERILEQAAECLNGHGLSQTTLGRVAERLGVTRAALYYYVKDQQDLVFLCLGQSCEAMTRCLEEAQAENAGTLRAIAAFVEGMAARRPEIAVLTEVGYLRAEQQQSLLDLYRALTARLVALIDEGMRRGEVRRVNSTIAAQAIIALVSWAPLTRRWPPTSMPRARIAQAINTICSKGIARRRSLDFHYQPLTVEAPSIPVMSLFDNDALMAAKRLAIVTSASWIFNRKGINATSLEEIALSMGVTSKVIYHNVGSKQELVTECYRRAFAIALGLAERAANYDGTRLQAISALGHATAEASLREDVALLRTLVGLGALPPDVQQECDATARRLLRIHGRLHAQGQAEGSLRPFDVRGLLSILHATHEWLPMWFGDADAADKSKIASDVTEFSRLGLAPL